MASLLELIAISRVFALREAIVATFDPLIPDCEVRGHPGKLDIADVVAEESLRAPSLNVAVIRQARAEARLSGLRDVPVEIAVYIVTEDMALGDPPKAYGRDEIGFALCDGVLAIVANPSLARWGLSDIGYPEDAEAKPVFTARAFAKGTAYYAVTWRQVLYGLGDPFVSMEGEPAPGWTPGVEFVP